MFQLIKIFGKNGISADNIGRNTEYCCICYSATRLTTSDATIPPCALDGCLMLGWVASATSDLRRFPPSEERRLALPAFAGSDKITVNGIGCGTQEATLARLHTHMAWQQKNPLSHIKIRRNS